MMRIALLLATLGLVLAAGYLAAMPGCQRDVTVATATQAGRVGLAIRLQAGCDCEVDCESTLKLRIVNFRVGLRFRLSNCTSRLPELQAWRSRRAELILNWR